MKRFMAFLAVLVSAITVVARPAGANHQDRGRVEVRGIVVSIDRKARTFYLQPRRSQGGLHVLAVLVDRRTDFEFKGLHDRDDDDEDDEDFDRRTRRFRRLVVGDIVEVQGRLIDHGAILAREVLVEGRARRVPPTIVGSIPTPVIVFPYDGMSVNGHEFLLAGRTVGRARVIIQLAIVFGPVAFQTLHFETTADDAGAFATTIRPGFVRRGVQYRITVQSDFQGVQSPPATVTVRQD